MELPTTLASRRRQIQRAEALTPAAEERFGIDLPWQEPDGELDRVLVVLDGGLLD